jgi:hypothetical protein
MDNSKVKMENNKDRRQSFYKRLKEEGRYGYFKDATWDREKKIHKCCKSKARWYHKVNCPAASEDIVLGKDKAYMTISKHYKSISKLKKEGLTSIQISKKLDLPLSTVNKIYSEVI